MKSRKTDIHKTFLINVVTHKVPLVVLASSSTQGSKRASKTANKGISRLPTNSKGSSFNHSTKCNPKR